MSKIISTLLSLGLASLLFSFTLAQEKKSTEPPRPAQSFSQELSWGWDGIGKKLIAMAEDFPENQYGFKAQKDERTFGENLLHVAYDCNIMFNAMKGSAEQITWNEDSLYKKYPTKEAVVNYLKQSVADGAELIKTQGDSTLTREINFPWGNFMSHGLLGWMGIIEHAGEHYGQLVVYYRVNGMIPPASRPAK